MAIKKFDIVEIKPINLEARLYEGIAKITFKNGHGPEVREVPFRVRFNHEYDPITNQFKPKIYPKTGEPWNYAEDPFGSAVVSIETSSFNGDLSAKVKEYFDIQFKQQYK